MGEKKRRSAQGHAAKARALAAQSAFGPALEELVFALELAPEIHSLWAQFGDLIRFFNFRHPLDTRLRAILARARPSGGGSGGPRASDHQRCALARRAVRG